MIHAVGLLGALLFTVALDTSPAEGEHPLAPLVRYAQDRVTSLDAEIRDYTCTLVKQERIDGRLRKPDYIFVKLRHQRVENGKVMTPFSVYLRYLAPRDLKDREVLYVEGRNEGKMIARRGGSRLAHVTTTLLPDSRLAMHWGRYPLTEIGIKTLTERLVEVGLEELAYGECEVKYLEGAKINGRSCIVVQVTHPVKRDYFRYHMARVFIDRELMLPVHYVSYDWPEQEGGEPELMEQYTYVDLKLNPGLTDRDFDPRNKEYQFGKPVGE
ncbi:MAG TPA: hypothetical protein DD670_05380 [Planctomycetaceae bacterium]|nr:hypothetical protein [Planctomycetaceae bacterium]